MPIGLYTGLGAGGGVSGAFGSGQGTAIGVLDSEFWSSIGSGVLPGCRTPGAFKVSSFGVSLMAGAV